MPEPTPAAAILEELDCTPEDEQLARLDSGLVVPQRIAFELRREKLRYTCVDVFCGCGGMSLGAIQAGMEVVAAIDSDPIAIMTYMANLCRWGQVTMHFIEAADETRLEKAIWREFKRRGPKLAGLPVAGGGWIASQPADTPGVSHIIVGDVRKLSGQQLLDWIGIGFGDLGCMVGSPPCQGFSTSGRRRVGDERNSLVFEFARLIVETSPATCVMENVPGILTMKTPKGVPVVQRFCQILRDGGFHGVEAFERLIDGKHRTGGFRGDAKKRKRALRKATPNRAR